MALMGQPFLILDWIFHVCVNEYNILVHKLRAMAAMYGLND